MSIDLPSVLQWLGAEGLERLRLTFGPTAAYGAPALTGAMLFSVLYYVQRRRERGRRASLRGFVRSIFAARIVLAKSSLVDMRLWTLNALVLASGYGCLAVGNVFCRDLVVAGLTRALGPHAPSAWPSWAVLSMATLFELLAYDLAYWFAHYLFHRIPALWEFHKVHHSAEVMTPLTELREHPVEILAFMNLIAIATGAVFGVMTYAFGPGVRPFTLLNGNIALMGFLITYGHLRHSHMWIPFTGLVGKLLQSPAHHQIHHSTHPKHFDKNLGFALAMWDWLFGTLYVPSKEPEALHFGVAPDEGDFSSVARSFATPFVRIGERVAKAAHPLAPGPKTAPEVQRSPG
ncbi:MAG: sterol desaturase family protein [Hyphomicrobiales bacterium]|nr:sterol desaturase family protein [Hyphomicrobiales bacterium]